MSWTYDQETNPDGFGLFFVYMWDGQTTTSQQQSHLPIGYAWLADDVAHIAVEGDYTDDFVNGDAITVSGLGHPYDGLVHITSNTFSMGQTYFTYDCVHADIDAAVVFGDVAYGEFSTVSVVKHDYTDVTFFRETPTIVREMTFSDPFGDATATLEFRQCTGFDGPYTDPPTNSIPSETWWLRENVNVDIMWVPATTTVSDYPVINPTTNQYGLYLDFDAAEFVWEGFTTSVDPSANGVTLMCQGALFQLDRYYAKPLYPVAPKATEQMIARYFDPLRRGIYTQRLEIEEADMRTYTADDKTIFKGRGGDGSFYIPTGLEPGDLWTGYITRNTGGWDQALTGYIRSQLSFMYAIPEDYVTKRTINVSSASYVSDAGLAGYDGGMITLDVPVGHALSHAMLIDVSDLGWPYDGQWKVYDVTGTTVRYKCRKGLQNVVPASSGHITVANYDDEPLLFMGDQWTITKKPERIPYMYLRRQSKAPTLVAWYGQPGVEATLNRDGSQSPNVIYGRGVGFDGSEWMTQNQSPDYQWFSWRPLAYDDEIYQFDNWDEATQKDLYDGYDAEWERQNGIWVKEQHWQSIPAGIEYEDGLKIARQYVERDKDPGWSGDVNIRTDLVDMDGNIRSKWSIKVGDVLWLKGFYGTDGVTPVQGINKFHIASVTMNPQEGQVSVRVDTRFRDLLSVEEAMKNSRDPLSPVKMLQIGKSSSLVEDLAIPWNRKGGAGCIPPKSVGLKLSTSFDLDGHVADTSRSGNRPIDLLKHNSPAYTNTHLTAKTKGGTTTQGGMVWGSPSENDRLTVHYKDPDKAFYIPVNCGNPDPSMRWGFYTVILSQAGTISGIELAAYDINGNPAEVQFAVGIWPVGFMGTDSAPRYQVTPGAGNPFTYAALWKGAYSTVDENSNPWPVNGDQNMTDHVGGAGQPIAGWGTYDKPCGYYPHTPDQTVPDACTGKFKDGSNWTYNFTNAREFGSDGRIYARGDKVVDVAAYSYGLSIYAENPGLAGQATPNGTSPHWAFFMGRLIRQPNIGTN